MINKTNPTPSNNILARLMVKIDVKMIISTGAIVAILSYLAHILPLTSQPKQLKQSASAQAQLRSFSRIDYEQLRIGMSLTDVRAAILNSGVEVSRSSTVATFVWENPDGSKIIATFENDKLKSKEQTGLK